MMSGMEATSLIGWANWDRELLGFRRCSVEEEDSRLDVKLHDDGEAQPRAFVKIQSGACGGLLHDSRTTIRERAEGHMETAGFSHTRCGDGGTRSGSLPIRDCGRVNTEASIPGIIEHRFNNFWKRARDCP